MAPRKRGGRGISFIFCCFRNNDHPEITYRLRNDSNFALQPMEPALPMPPGEELDGMFSELVVSRGFLCWHWWQRTHGGAEWEKVVCGGLCLVCHGLLFFQGNSSLRFSFLFSPVGPEAVVKRGKKGVFVYLSALLGL